MATQKVCDRCGRTADAPLPELRNCPALKDWRAVVVSALDGSNTNAQPTRRWELCGECVGVLAAASPRLVTRSRG